MKDFTIENKRINEVNWIRIVLYSKRSRDLHHNTKFMAVSKGGVCPPPEFQK